MRRALKLARRGRGRVSPNPLVGAVVVHEGAIVGEGTHFFDRKEHAEAVALEQAGSRARGAELYVNLEPCRHYGRTAPCVERIQASGIRRVFYSIADPNPEAGGGGDWLRSRGVDAEAGLLAERAARCNEVFLHYISTGRPFVVLKLGMTLDGRIAGPRRDSRWITGAKARRRVHRLRHDYDSVLVGIETVLADNPSLNVRTKHPNSIAKIVLDSMLRTPPDARIFESGDAVTIFHGPEASAENRGRLADRATLREVEVDGRGLEWDSILDRLSTAGLTSLLVEGGGRVAASALAAGVVCKLMVFYGPKIVGSGGVAGVGDLAIERLSEAIEWRHVRARRAGEDVLVTAYPR